MERHILVNTLLHTGYTCCVLHTCSSHVVHANAIVSCGVLPYDACLGQSSHRRLQSLDQVLPAVRTIPMHGDSFHPGDLRQPGIAENLQDTGRCLPWYGSLYSRWCAPWNRSGHLKVPLLSTQKAQEMQIHILACWHRLLPCVHASMPPHRVPAADSCHKTNGRDGQDTLSWLTGQ